MGRLILVSHRLPVTVTTHGATVKMTPSVGGLATALSRVHRAGRTLWIGSPGDLAGVSAEQRPTILANLEKGGMVGVEISAADARSYYEGLSNGVLWPLLHALTDRLPLDSEESWRAYRRVNAAFAHAVAAQYQPGDRIWVHDYQLALVPGLLRELLPAARTGFFLHVPFPSAETFCILPWRAELLHGVLSADVIGFQTAGHRRNFLAAAAKVLKRDTIDGSRFGVFPVGVDVSHIAHLAEATHAVREISLLRETGEESVILGVDRLDYTKGIPRRLLAFERLLERHPEWLGRVRLVQVAVPSRERVAGYEEYRSTVDAIVGRINGKCGSSRVKPIEISYRPSALAELVALYRAADVMSVTPLRDGMNLVAKEFVASRIDGDGVLILSEFAGAADELEEALVVNPFDLSGVADTMHIALTMPRAERQARMRALRRRVTEHDVHAWANGFIHALGRPGDEATTVAHDS